MSRQFSARLSVGGLLVFGTTSSLLAKIAYELDGVGRDGKEKNFTKPWCMTTVMFLGMSLCLPLAYLEEHRAKKGALTKAEEPLVGGPPEVVTQPKPHSEWRQLMLLAIPTVFDLIATIFMNIGLLSVTASVYQMMRGAEMLFAALFSLLFLGRRLNLLHLGGIMCCVAGIACVGLSSILAGSGSADYHVSSGDMLAGMGLIIASQCVQAAQLTFEDYFMADLSVAPLKIVGVEGLFGSIIMVGALLPLVSVLPGEDGSGLHEDTLDTLHMVRHSRTIPLLLVVDMAALLMYNLAGMCVTGTLGAVFRTVLETMRTLFVWLVDLVLFYLITAGRLGEAWSKWSFVQLFGFVVLVCGTLIYGRGDDAEMKKAQGEEPEDPSALTQPLIGHNLPPTQPAGVPERRESTQPIAMRATPSSYKSTMSIASFGGTSVPRSSMRRSSMMSPPAHLSHPRV